MDKKEFAKLDLGDKFKFRGDVRTVCWAERYMVSPGVSETYSLSDEYGYRVIINDAVVAEMTKVEGEKK
jgi:hypothetical protein